MERNLAVLIDFENIATGCDKEGLGRFDIRIVMRRLKDKGRILVARSYADWGRWNRFKLDLVHEGVQMVELTSHGMQSKNRADIALAVDAMELAYTRAYVDTFVILSGDSDFTPLVMRLKELNKRVIGCGTRRSTSRLIAETCDEFFFYDTLRDESRTVVPKKPSAAAEEDDEEEVLTLDEALELLVETLENHQRDEPGAVHGSVLKASMKRKEPTFSEVELGVRTFAQFLETAQQKGLVRLFRDEKAGGFRVDLPQTTHEEAAPPPPRTPARTLSPEAQRLQGLLAEAGLEIGEPRERRVIVEHFVGVCAERAKRNRTCAVQFVLGDLLRRVKQEAPEIPPRTVKAVTHALRRAGVLFNTKGEAALASTAPFVAPESASQLLDELHGAGLRSLEARGENPDDAVLTELFVGTEVLAPPDRAARPAEPSGGEAAPGGPTDGEGRDGEAREGGRRRRRRGGRGRGRREGDLRDGAGPDADARQAIDEAAAELGWPALIGEGAPASCEAFEAGAGVADEAPLAVAAPEGAGSEEPTPVAAKRAAPARKPRTRRKQEDEPPPPPDEDPVLPEPPPAFEALGLEGEPAGDASPAGGAPPPEPEAGEAETARKPRRRGGLRGKRAGGEE